MVRKLAIFFRTHLSYFHFPSETLQFVKWHKLFASPLYFFSKQVQADYIRSIEKYYPQGRKYLFMSGRMGLYAYLSSLELEKGSVVVVPPFTCEVVINAIKYLNLEPVYCDIRTYDFSYNCENLIRVIKEKKPKVIIAQHSFGIPCDVEKIIELARKSNAVVVEDCAHAFGIEHKGKKLGSFGDAAFFSTDQTKTFSTLLGGILIVNSKTPKPVVCKAEPGFFFQLNLLFQQLYFKIFNHDYLFWFTKYFQSLLYRTGLFVDLKDNNVSFTVPENYPMALSNVQAYWGILQIEKLERNFEQRKKSVAFIEKNLGIKKYTGLPLLRYPLLISDRGNIQKYEKYIEFGNWFNVPALGRVHGFELIGYCQGSCPVAESIHQRIINIPLLPVRFSFYQKLISKLVEDLSL